jgi:two-component system, LytTR family, response regulator
MNVVILEDEERTARHLVHLLEDCVTGIRIMASLASVNAAEEWLNSNPPPDLIFMDIHLEDASVFDLFKRITITTPVVFVTAYDDYLVEAFKVNSIDYLLKPVQLADVKQALSKYAGLEQHFRNADYDELIVKPGLKQQGTYKHRFLITAGTKMFPVETENIAYAVLVAKATYLITHTNSRYIVNHSLEELENLLDPTKFFRINRQYIISLTSVVFADTSSQGRLKLRLNPSATDDVIVSGDRVSHFKSWLGK